MIRSCATADDRLLGFAAGGEADLDAHIATCDECQDFLAELWAGELTVDLSEPVMTTLRFEQFLLEAAKMFGGVVGRMGRAAPAYILGLAQDEPDNSAGDGVVA